MKKCISFVVALLILSNAWLIGIFPASGFKVSAASTISLIKNFGAQNGGAIRVAEWDVTPSSADADFTVGLAGNSAAPAAPSDLPAAVRLGPDGTVSAASGSAYTALQSVSYTVGSSLHVKLMVNLPAQTFDAWVTPAGGSPVLLAKDFAFSQGTAALGDIGGLYATSGGACSVQSAALIEDTYVSKANFSQNVYPIESDNVSGRSLVIRFDMKLASDNVDGLIGFADSGKSIASYTDLAYIVHSEVGTSVFDVRNDGAYQSDQPIDAKGGVTYHVKLVPDLAQKLYDVWIAPEGGAPVHIASNYKIRNFSTTTLNELGKVCVYSAADGSLTISHFLTLDGGQLSAAVAAVNGADTDADMKAALSSTSLGLSLEKYRSISETAKNYVAQDMLAAKPFADDMAIQQAFENAVVSAVAQADTQPPSAPGDVAVAATDSMQAKITWTPATDDTGVQYYKVFRDGAELATVSSGTTYVDSGLSPATTYQYVVKAYDIVLRETASPSVSVTTCPAGREVAFPFTQSVLAAQFRQGPLKYTLQDSGVQVPGSDPKVDYQYVMDWNIPYMSSATALYYLTVASVYDPGYLSSDGGTTVSQRALEQIRSVIAGGNEPGCSGSGLSAQGYIPVLESLAIAKLKVPAIWNQLSDTEKGKIDLIMQAALVGAHWAFSDKNDNETGIDQTGNFDKLWNPNHRDGGVAAAVAADYYLGADAANQFLKDFDYDTFTAALKAAGLTNIATVFANTGKTQLEACTKNDDASGFTYMGHTLDQPGLWIQEIANYTFSGTVSPVGGAQVPVSPTYPEGSQGFLVSGYDGYPNLGASGMGFEFDAVDANGRRSSLGYVYMGWRSVIEGYYSIALLAGETGLTTDDWASMTSKLDVGSTDLFYKQDNGYNDYDKGSNLGTANLAVSYPSSYDANHDLWLNVMNNPQAAVESVNAAQDTADMRAALESQDLNLVLYGYQALSGGGQDAVAASVRGSRPAGGYSGKSAVQQALYQAVTAQGLQTLNGAAAASDMAAALKSNALGLYIPQYDNTSSAVRQTVDQMLIDQRPLSGYADKAAVRAAVQAAVESAAPSAPGQLKNLPAVTGTNTRINLADYNAPLDQPGDAHVTLWNDDKTGAYSVTIDDNNDAEHPTWLNYSSQYGFKFTWFAITNAANPVFNTAEWTKMLAAGEDVQSHTAHHYTAAQMATLTAEQRENEYAQPIQVIDALPGGNVKTLAFANDYQNPDLASQYYIAARGTLGYSNQANNVNYLNTNSISITADLNQAYNGANNVSIEGSIKTLFDPGYKVWGTSYYQGWTVILCHSINRDIILNKNVDLKPSVQYMLGMLQQYQDQVWVGTYTDVAMYGEERDTSKLTVTDNTADQIKFTLTDQMDDSLFDYPLTVKVRLEDGWKNVVARQNGAYVPVSVVDSGSGQYALVKAVPDRGEVTVYPVSLQAVNEASTAGEMQAAITADDSGLNLTHYDALTASEQGEVAQRLLSGRPADGYEDLASLQTALDGAADAVLFARLLQPVNQAVTVNEMEAAVTASDLGLNLAAFEALPADGQAQAAQRLLIGRPADGYTARDELQSALDSAVDCVTVLTASVNLSADTFISEVAPTTNYGSQSWIQTKGWPGGRRSIYQRYDLSGLNGMSPDAIDRVTVQLYPTAMSGGTSEKITVYGLSDNSWPETSLTWNTTVDDPSTGYTGQYKPDATPLGSVTVTGLNQTYSFDVTDYVKARLAAGAASVSFVYEGDSSDTALVTYTAIGSNRAPKMTVTSQAVTPLQAVNAAGGVSAMKAALDSTELGLDLTAYRALSETGRDAVARMLLDARPQAGYTDAAAVQQALDDAVTEARTPPRTTASVSGTANSGWYTSPVTVTLSAASPSGILRTEYRLDSSGDWTAYSGPFTLSQDGQWTVEFRSVDRAGNVEEPLQQTVAIDTTAPETTASVSGTLNNGWYISPVTVALNAADGGSGAVKTEYRLNGGGWTAYAGPFTLSQDGRWTVAFRSTDQAGNVEESKEQTVQIDRTPPTLQWTSEQKLVRKGFFFWFDSILTLHLQDALSGAASAEVTVGGMSGSFVPDAQSDVQIDLGERIAVRTVNVQARDAAGNTLTRTLHLIVLPGIGVFPCP